MQQFWQQAATLAGSIFGSVRLTDFIDVLIVAVLIYWLIALTRGTRASQLFKGIAVLLALYLISGWMSLRMVNKLMGVMVSSGVVIIAILFQGELRRAIERIGRAGSTPLGRLFGGGEDASAHRGQAEIAVSEITSAMINLSRRRVGALIVVERNTRLSEVLESGTRIDAEISAPLLENIFEPNTPLHDGAVVICGTRVEAAACILPLTQSTALSRELGTRHRASLGISESTDSVALVVSEETGIISVARGGTLTRNLDAASLREVLNGLFVPEENVSLWTLLMSGRKPRKKGP